MNCIITGLFDNYEPDELAKLVIRHGGQVSGNVTGTVTHMICGKPGVIGPYNTKTGKGSKKYRDAKKKKRIQCVEESFILEIIAGKKSL